MSFTPSYERNNLFQEAHAGHAGDTNLLFIKTGSTAGSVYDVKNV